MTEGRKKKHFFEYEYSTHENFLPSSVVETQNLSPLSDSPIKIINLRFRACEERVERKSISLSAVSLLLLF